MAFPPPKPVDPDQARRDQLAIITRKALVGDEQEKKYREEHGTNVADRHAAMAATNANKCSCRRGGIICGRDLEEGRYGVCWPCWAAIRDGKTCPHAVKPGEPEPELWEGGA